MKTAKQGLFSIYIGITMHTEFQKER